MIETKNFVHNMKYLIEIPETCQVEILRSANQIIFDSSARFVPRACFFHTTRRAPARLHAIRTRPSKPASPPLPFRPILPCRAQLGPASFRASCRGARGTCAAVDEANLKKRRRSVA